MGPFSEHLRRSPAADSPVAVPPLTGRRLIAIALGIAIFTVLSVIALWWAGTRGLAGDQLVAARFDALKIGLSVGVGSGGVLALYLAWRRQQSIEIGLRQKDRDQYHDERVADAVEADARERRITDLYTKAADQLGADKAPVRLAGLYALERLGQDNEMQRQTIVFVLCAYLRMPYRRPEELPADAADDLVVVHHERMQEREVRLTAQRILHRHRRSALSADWWEVASLNLSGAELAEVDFSGADLTGANFASAQLPGVDFSGANLADAVLKRTNLTEAQLQRASLARANLAYSNLMFADLSHADLSGAFLPSADFSNAHLVGASLIGADLAGAELSNADLTGADLTGAHLIDTTLFGEPRPPGSDVA